MDLYIRNHFDLHQIATLFDGAWHINVICIGKRWIRVTYDTAKLAYSIQKRMNGKRVFGKVLEIKQSREYNRLTSVTDKSFVVHDLPSYMSIDDVRKQFSEIGPCVATQPQYRTALIKYNSVGDAQKAKCEPWFLA